MELNVIHIDDTLNSRVLVQLTYIIAKVWVRCYELSICFKIYNVHFIKPNQSHEQPDIQSSHFVTENVSLSRKDFLCPIQ